MIRPVWIALAFAALGAAPAHAQTAAPAQAETAAALVGRLVADGCMPIVTSGAATPAIPAGGVALSTAKKKALGMNPKSSAWSYAASDDSVVLELGAEGCNIFTQGTGDETYLKALERAVSVRHPRLYVETDEASGGDKLRWRNYVVPMAAEATAKGAVQALSVTYSTAETKPGGRMFFVGVLPTQKRE